MNADAIAVVDNGSVVDVGTHNELLARCGLYQRLASMQFKEPEDKVDETQRETVPAAVVPEAV
jgi:ABC-type transport system involved in cytochrome bd biosynthesis fused ATPase/permease subunit